MTPDSVLAILEILLRYGPDSARAAKDILIKENTTNADWEHLFHTAQKKEYPTQNFVDWG